MLEFLYRFSETKKQSIERRLKNAKIKLAGTEAKLAAIITVQRSKGYWWDDSHDDYIRAKRIEAELIKEIQLLEAEDKECAS